MELATAPARLHRLCCCWLRLRLAPPAAWFPAVPTCKCSTHPCRHWPPGQFPSGAVSSARSGPGSPSSAPVSETSSGRSSGKTRASSVHGASPSSIGQLSLDELGLLFGSALFPHSLHVELPPSKFFGANHLWHPRCPFAWPPHFLHVFSFSTNRS